jgi:hypothetical protein
MESRKWKNGKWKLESSNGNWRLEIGENHFYWWL